MTFEGFSAEGLAFLEALPSRDSDWFKANKRSYTDLVADPAKAFVQAFGEAIADVAPNVVAQPKTNGSIAPINNDLRFSPDKPPYKDHLMFRFWEGAKKKTAPTLFVRMTPTEVGFASGWVPPDTNSWRAAIDGPGGAAIADGVAQLVKAKKADVAGQELKKVPAPFAAEHPRADLLRHKMVQVRWIEKLPASARKPAFASWCAGRLEAALPLHRALVAVNEGVV